MLYSVPPRQRGGPGDRAVFLLPILLSLFVGGVWLYAHANATFAGQVLHQASGFRPGLGDSGPSTRPVVRHPSSSSRRPFTGTGSPSISEVRATRPAVPGAGPIGPAPHSIRALDAGHDGIAKHARLVSGEGAGPGYCLAHDGYPFGASLDGVYACGPSLGAPQPFDTSGFQCVELSERFLWVVYGRVIRKVYDGSELVALGHEQLHIPVGTPGKGRVPAVGDIVSMSGTTADPAGHTAVVTAINVNSHGNGAIQLMEENGSLSGWDYLDVHHWAETFGDPKYAHGYYHYTHVSWLKLAGPSHSTPSVARMSGLNYTVRTLPSTALVNGVNDSGWAVGMTDQRDKHHEPIHRAVLFNGKHSRVLKSPKGIKYLATASAVDPGGVAAGWAIHTGGDVSPYVLRPLAKQRWNRLPGVPRSSMEGQAIAIGPSGSPSGWVSGAPNSSTFGALWTHSNSGFHLVKLRANRFFRYPLVLGTDAFDDAIGTEMLGDNRTFAVLWTSDGVAHRLPSLYKRAQVDIPSALSVKLVGTTRELTIAGTSGTWNGHATAVRWSITIAHSKVVMSRPQIIGMPSGFASSSATSITPNGWIAGNMFKGRGAARGFIAPPGHQAFYVGSLLSPHSRWIIERVNDVNNSGEVAATGYPQGGTGTGARPRAILLIPKS